MISNKINDWIAKLKNSACFRSRRKYVEKIAIATLCQTYLVIDLICDSFYLWLWWVEFKRQEGSRDSVQKLLVVWISSAVSLYIANSI